MDELNGGWWWCEALLAPGEEKVLTRGIILRLLHPDPERLVNVQGWDQGASEFWRKSEEYTFLRCSRNFSDAPFKLNRPHLRF